MSRAVSDILGDVLARAELSSSILIGLDDAQRYGDITRVEHDVANKRISRWLEDNEELVYQTFAVKKEAFKQFIREVKANESMRTG
jgi:hypothetical protein